MGVVRSAVEGDLKAKLKDAGEDIEEAIRVKEDDLKSEKGKEKANQKSIDTLKKAKKQVDEAIKTLKEY